MATIIRGLFEWEELKNNSNIEKHGIGFADARLISAGYVLEARSPFDREERIAAVGMLRGKEYTVIYTQRNGRKRLISARRARKSEKEAYHRAYKGVSHE